MYPLASSLCVMGAGAAALTAMHMKKSHRMDVPPPSACASARVATVAAEQTVNGVSAKRVAVMNDLDADLWTWSQEAEEQFAGQIARESHDSDRVKKAKQSLTQYTLTSSTHSKTTGTQVPVAGRCLEAVKKPKVTGLLPWGMSDAYADELMEEAVMEETMSLE